MIASWVQGGCKVTSRRVLGECKLDSRRVQGDFKEGAR